ncbi:MAG TPA: carboxypeptidase-like regulatory domain-containing protein [Pirellulales bacterium]|nr:carboxypeptidase-like regulatory domain-containing protein [Pirellulales bacterium]
MGVVVDENGRTIAGATVRSALQVGPGNAGEKNGDSGPVLATTDEAGRFTLDSLDDGSQYAFLVEAQEHGRRLFPHIYAGAENLRFEVGPDFIVRGRIMGDLASLRHDAGRPIVESNQQPSIQVASDFSYGLLFTNRSPVDVIDGEGRFELKNLLPGQLSVTAAKRTVTVNLETPVTELTIDLTGKPPVPQMRPVVLRFVGPDPTLAPTGQLEVNIGDHAKIGAPINKRVNIEDGAVRLDAYADGYVNYAARNIVGYWFADGMVTVTPGDGPLEQDVEIVPAGAVRGRVLNANGSPASNGVHVGTKIRYHFSPQRWTTTGINNVPVDVQGNFFLSPLPFGADGDYVIVASRGHEQAVSAPVRVDEQHISPQVEIRFSPTASASGVVVGTDGAPRGGVEVKLWFRNGIADTIYSPGTQTNAEGRFTFEGLSTGVGDYWATLDGASRPPRIEVKLNPGGAPVRLIVPDERAQK